MGIEIKLGVDRIYGHGESFEIVTIKVPPDWIDINTREIKPNIKAAILKNKIKVEVKCEDLGWD